MNPKITPEIETALQQQPVGPIRLERAPGSAPVYLVRTDDLMNLQEFMDNQVREKLAEADEAIALGDVAEWDYEAFRQSMMEQVTMQDR